MAALLRTNSIERCSSLVHCGEQFIRTYAERFGATLKNNINMRDLNLILEFSAGAELLFGNIKRRQLSLDGAQKWTIAKLLKWMHANILTERPELFLQGDTVRPGILVLINDTDWELLGELEYELQENDNVLFISTLHGG